MKMIKSLGASGAVYFIGIAALFVLDFIISSKSSVSTVADWAHFRSLFTFVPPLLLLGMNMAVVRYTNLIGLSLQLSAGLGLISAILLLAGITVDQLFLSYSAMFAVSCGMLSASILRSKLHMMWAQISLNLWKVLCLAFAIFTVFSFECLIIIITISSISVFLGMIISVKDFRSLILVHWWNDFLAIRDRIADSLMLSFFSIMTGFSVSFFLIFSGIMFSESEVANIFRLMIILQAPAVLAAGFAGFALTPLIREKPHVGRLYIKYRFPIYIVVFAAQFIMSIMIPIILNIFHYDYFLGAGYLLMALLACESAVRVCYTLETSYFGALFVSDELKRFTKMTLALLILSVGVVFGLNVAGRVVPEVLMGVSLAHWVGRLIVAGALVSKQAASVA